MSVPVTTLATTAVKNLRATAQRTLLALIGIVVGIGSVTAMVSIGDIARTEAIKQFVKLGTDVIRVIAYTSSNTEERRKRTPIGLLPIDLAELTNLRSIHSSAAFTSRWGTLAGSNQSFNRVKVIGISENFMDLAKLEVENGRALSPLDGNKPVAMVGQSVVQQLQNQWKPISEGNSVQVDDVVYQVVGTLVKDQGGMPNVRPNDAIFVPLGQIQRLQGSTILSQITLKLMSDVHYLTARSEIRGYFRRVAPRLEVRVDSPVELIEQMDAQMRLFAILLGAVGSIALVVGGFGVMNALLASISDQRKEIGIRRALGARRSDIQWQFLFESLLFCVIGGAAGSVIGIVTTFIVCLFADWSYSFSVLAPMLGVGTALIVGLFFGYYPARQAARLDPIVALRRD